MKDNVLSHVSQAYSVEDYTKLMEHASSVVDRQAVVIQEQTKIIASLRETIKIHEGKPFVGRPTKWREHYLSESGYCVKYAMARIVGYLVCAVKFNEKVGLSFCSPKDQGDRSDFDYGKSIELAFSRPFLREVRDEDENNSMAVESYVCVATTSAMFNVPRVVENKVNEMYNEGMFGI